MRVRKMGGLRAPEAGLSDEIPSFFDGVPAEDLELVLAGLERRRFAAGAVVIAEGDQANELYI